MHNGLALTGSGEPDNGLSGTDHLTRFCQRIHDNAIGVGQQHRITRCILRDAGLGLCGSEIGSGCIGGGLYLVVG